MKMAQVGILSTAMFIGVSALTLPAEAGWQMTEWGMSIETVHSVVPDARLNFDRDNDTENLRARVWSTYQANDISFKVYFLFNHDHKLARVDLNPESVSECPMLMGAIHSAYGTPELDNPGDVVSITRWRDVDTGNLLTVTKVADVYCTVAYEPIPVAGEMGGL